MKEFKVLLERVVVQAAYVWVEAEDRKGAVVKAEALAPDVDWWDAGVAEAAEVVGIDPETDVAVVKLAPVKGLLATVRLGDADQIKVGQKVLVVGICGSASTVYQPAFLSCNQCRSVRRWPSPPWWRHGQQSAVTACTGSASADATQTDSHIMRVARQAPATGGFMFQLQAEGEEEREHTFNKRFTIAK